MGCCNEKDTQPSLITTNNSNNRRFERNKGETNNINSNTTNITNFNTKESKIVIIEVNNVNIISPMTPKVKKSSSSIKINHIKDEHRKNFELSKYSYLFSDQPNKHVKTAENYSSLIDSSPSLATKDYRRASVFLLDHNLHDNDLSFKSKRLKKK